MEIDTASLNSEIATSIARLSALKAEASSLSLKAFRETFDMAWRALEELEATGAGNEEAPRFVEQLTRLVAGHVQSAVEQVQGEADIRVQAAVAETKRQRHEIATLSAQLEERRQQVQALEDGRAADRRQGTAAAAEAARLRAEATEVSERLKAVRIEAERLRSELDTERKQASSMVLEVGQCRMAAEQAEEAKVEMAAALQKESNDRKAFESELLETKTLLEAARKEVTAIRQKLRVAVAEAVKLVAAADALETPEAPAAPPTPATPAAPPPSDELLKKTLLTEPPPAAAVESQARLESLGREQVDAQPTTPDESKSFRRRLAAMVRG